MTYTNQNIVFTVNGDVLQINNLGKSYAMNFDVEKPDTGAVDVVYPLAPMTHKITVAVSDFIEFLNYMDGVLSTMLNTITFDDQYVNINLGLYDFELK